MKTGKGAIGVGVVYGYQDASFLADVITVGNVCVVVAAVPITDKKGLSRPARINATYRMVQGVKGSYWAPHKGIFVVPSRDLQPIEKEAPRGKKQPKRK